MDDNDDNLTDTERAALEADELTGVERAALDAWRPFAPPAGFADRVLAAQLPPVAKRSRRVLVAGGIAAAVAAVAIVFVVARPPQRAVSGNIAAEIRTTAVLGDRGVAVAEPAASLTWRVDDHGAAEVEQRAGNVFYRIERGEPFVVHTPAGDIRVTGTCFRIEVEPMKPNHKMIMSGAAGAALATAVLVTVYEGHVVAETKSSRTELPAGTRATLAPDGTTTTPFTVADSAPADMWRDPLAHATREELVARTAAQQDQLIRLRSRVRELEENGGQSRTGDPDSPDEPGRLWHDPSPEKLIEWARDCEVRVDHPDLDAFTPLKSASSNRRGLEANELDGYNEALGEVAKKWQALVRSLYLEATGDTVGADSLSIEAMRHEIQEKSPREEMGLIRQKLANERAGLAAPPPSTAKLSPLERLMRAYTQLGDQTEATLGKRIGDKRARDIRGDAWDSRSRFSGCDKHD